MYILFYAILTILPKVPVHNKSVRVFHVSICMSFCLLVHSIWFHSANISDFWNYRYQYFFLRRWGHHPHTPTPNLENQGVETLAKSERHGCFYQQSGFCRRGFHVYWIRQSFSLGGGGGCLNMKIPSRETHPQPNNFTVDFESNSCRSENGGSKFLLNVGCKLQFPPRQNPEDCSL